MLKLSLVWDPADPGVVLTLSDVFKFSERTEASSSLTMGSIGSLSILANTGRLEDVTSFASFSSFFLWRIKLFKLEFHELTVSAMLHFKNPMESVTFHKKSSASEFKQNDINIFVSKRQIIIICITSRIFHILQSWWCKVNLNIFNFRSENGSLSLLLFH